MQKKIWNERIKYYEDITVLYSWQFTLATGKEAFWNIVEWREGAGDRINFSFTVFKAFDNGYMGRQPVAWKEYRAKYSLREPCLSYGW